MERANSAKETRGETRKTRDARKEPGKQLVTSDDKNKGLISVNKDKFLTMFIETNIPATYAVRRSYAMWNILLPTAEEAEKVARTDVVWKGIWYKPEYLERRKTVVFALGIASQRNNWGQYYPNEDSNSGMQSERIMTGEKV